jgi:hypothetical protein
VIENAKDHVTKEKTGEFKLQCQKDQLSAALETEEHRGCRQAISPIASWKEGFAEDIHMYKKHGRHDIDVEYANNEEQFATQFFNFNRNTQTSLLVKCLFHKSIGISTLLCLKHRQL